MSYYVSSGQVSSGIYLGEYEDMYIYDGGVANYTTVNSYGEMCVSSGGTANKTTVNYSGYLYVSSGGTANSTSVNSYGRMYIYDGGVANYTTVNGGGDDYYYDDDGVLCVCNGGTANKTTVNSGGRISVESGGMANSATVDYGGYLYVSSGGTALNVVRTTPFARVNSEYGAIVTFANDFSGVYLSCGDTMSSALTMTGITLGYGEMYIFDGGVANSTTVIDGGHLYVSSGGVAKETAVERDCSMTVSKGGVASDTIVYVDAYLYVRGGVVSNTLATGSRTRIRLGDYDYDDGVSYGGSAVNTVVKNLAEMHVSSGACARSATVRNNGQIYVLNGGRVESATTVDWGVLYVFNGGRADDISVNNCGELHIARGGTATRIRENGGCVEIVNGANVTFVKNSFSGMVISSGMMTVHSGTVAQATTLKAGELAVYDGGVADSAALESGVANLYRGAKATGKLTISDRAVVSAYDGSVIDFNISNVAPGSAALVNDLSLVQGAPDYTITVSAAQATGNYALADGAATFGKTVTVNAASGKKLGTITVGQTLANGGSKYTLTKSGDQLLLKAVATGPAGPVVKASTTAPTNKNVTVTATFSADSVQKQYSTDNKTWKTYSKALTVSANGTYYFRGIDAAGNVSKVTSLTVSNIDKAAPNAPTVKASTTALTTKSVTVTATFSSDSSKKQYSTDNKTWKTYDKALTVSANGTYYFRGVDAAGNISKVATYTVSNIVGAGPTVKASTTALTNRDVTLTAAYSSDSSKKQYSTDNKTWKTYSKALTVSANGTYYFRGVDKNGKASAVTVFKVSNIDKAAPNAPTVKASTTALTTKSVTVTATFSSDSSKKQYSTDNKTWKTYDKALTVSANGTYYFRGVDAAGNISKVATYTVSNIVGAGPTVKASTTAPTNQNVTVTATFTKDAAKKQYSTNNKSWKTYSKALTVKSNATYYFRSLDASGVASKVTAFTVGNIDKKKPDAPAVKASTTALTNKNVTVTATFAKDVAKKQYSTDNKTWKTYSKALSVGTNGTYYFRGIDAAGNISKVKSIKIKNIDKVAPDAPKLKLSTAKISVKPVTISATFGKGSTVKEYSVDGKKWLTLGKSLKVSANGTYYFRSADAAGNVSKVSSIKVNNIASMTTANNNWTNATQLKGTVLAALDPKSDKVDYYDVGDVAKLMLDMESGKAKVTFCGSDKRAVATKVKYANGSVATLSSLDLVSGNKQSDNITLADLGDAVKYLKLESATKGTGYYRLAKLA